MPESYENNQGEATVEFNGVNVKMTVNGFGTKKILDFTDSDGKRYDITLTFDGNTLVVKKSPAEIFIRNITAADGETRSCQTQFTTGKPLDIVIEGYRFDTADSLALPVTVYDASGNQMRPELRWQLTTDNVEIAQGSALGNYRVDWTAIPRATIP